MTPISAARSIHKVGLEPSPWQRVAACRGLASELFYPQDDDAIAAAKAVCAVCPVSTQCLEHALVVREKEGIWGGATERERRSIIRRRRRAAARERAHEAEHDDRRPEAARG